MYISQLQPDEITNCFEGKATDSVNLFRDLLIAEALFSSIPLQNVSVTASIYTSDGGIDACVKDLDQDSINKLIRKEGSYYQIKSGKKESVTSLLFIKKEKEIHKFNDHIYTALKNNSYITFVYFGIDLTNQDTHTHLQEIKKSYTEFVKGNPQKSIGLDIDYDKFSVITANQLVALLTPFPSLIRRIKGLTGIKGLTHETWSSKRNLLEPFFGKSRIDKKNKLSEGIAEAFLNSKPFISSKKIYGTPGIGKTRLILEATRTNFNAESASSINLSPLVLYYETPSKFYNCEFESLFTVDFKTNLILIVDQCNQDDFIKINDEIIGRAQKSRIFFLGIIPTLSQSMLIDDSLTIYKLPDGEISEILAYDNPNFSINYILIKICSGSPAVALLINNFLKSQKTINIDDEGFVNKLWQKLLDKAYDNQPSGLSKVQIDLCLETIALFEMFGEKEPFEKEKEYILKIVNWIDDGIKNIDFNGIINDLRNKGILQGDKTLHISPFGFQIWLWGRFWSKYKKTFNWDSFLKNDELPPKLKEWFTVMFKFANEYDSVADICDQLLLGDTGIWIQDDSNFENKELASFFLQLAEARPKQSLECLKRTIGKWDIEKLSNLSSEIKSTLVRSLQKIIFKEELFIDGMRLLLKFIEAEKKNIWSPNAQNTFIGHFSQGWRTLAMSQLAPIKRFQLLEDLSLKKESPIREILFNCLSQALNTSYVRFPGSEQHGLESLEGWTPKTNEEFEEGFIWVLNFLKELIENPIIDSDRENAASILVGYMRGLFRFEYLYQNTHTAIIECLKTVVDFNANAEENIADAISEIFHYDKEFISKTILDSLLIVQQRIFKNNFYRDRLNLFIVNYRKKYTLDDNYQLVDLTSIEVPKLAKDYLGNIKDCKEDIKWLLEQKGSFCHQLASEIAKIDSQYTALDQFIEITKEAKTNNSDLLLGSYLRVIRQDFKDNNTVNRVLAQLSQEESLVKLLPALIWRASSEVLSEHDLKLLLTLLHSKKISITDLYTFKYGHLLTKPLSENLFFDLINFILNSKQQDDFFFATYLVNRYYFPQPKTKVTDESKKLFLEILLNPVYSKKIENTENIDSLFELNWSEIVDYYLSSYEEDSDYPSNCKKLLSTSLEAYMNNIFDNDGDFRKKVLSKLCLKFPKESLENIFQYLETNISYNNIHKVSRLLIDETHRKSYFDESYANYPWDLADSEILRCIPETLLWDWIDNDLEKRRQIFTQVLPKDICLRDPKESYTVKFLERYGDNEDVIDNVISHYQTGFSTGPYSYNCSNRQASLEATRKLLDQRSNTSEWINKYILKLNDSKVQARAHEERDMYH